MENSVLGYMIIGQIFYVASVACVPGQESGREQGGTYCLRWYLCTRVSDPLYLTKFPSMIHYPTWALH